MLYRKIIIKPSDGYFQDYSPVNPKKGSLSTHVILFIATLITTTVVGAIMAGANPVTSPLGIARGLPFSLTLLTILGIHEFGHYFAARSWKIDVTLPYFIPAPFIPIGTFGAVIKMKSTIPNRKALIDVGATGPVAGFVVSIIACVVGLHMSSFGQFKPDELSGNLLLGESLIFRLLGYLVHGSVPDSEILTLHPVAFAGWLGLFVTALNLIPIGQLDGGHILFALSPRIHEFIRRLRLPILLLMGVTFWSGWYLWAVILFFIGGPHPYPDYMDSRIGVFRRILAISTLAIFVLCIIPAPVKTG